MGWKELFKDYPRDMVKYAMMGMNEVLKTMILLGRVVDSKERLIELMSKASKGIQKDLEELNNEEGTI